MKSASGCSNYIGTWNRRSGQAEVRGGGWGKQAWWYRGSGQPRECAPSTHGAGPTEKQTAVCFERSQRLKLWSLEAVVLLLLNMKFPAWNTLVANIGIWTLLWRPNKMLQFSPWGSPFVNSLKLQKRQLSHNYRSTDLWLSSLRVHLFLLAFFSSPSERTVFNTLSVIVDSMLHSSPLSGAESGS